MGYYRALLRSYFILNILFILSKSPFAFFRGSARAVTLA